MSQVSDTKPSIHIHEAGAASAHLSEICAGMEEEGIPFTVVKSTGDAKTLAHEAANHSRLRVGIGITQESAQLQIRNCPDFSSTTSGPDPQAPTLNIKLDNPTPKCRALGTNAARAVKGGTFI